MIDKQNDYYSQGTEIKYEKSIGWYCINVFLFLLGMLIFASSLVKVIDVLVFNKLNFNIIGTYMVFLFSILWVVISMANLISYHGNKILISDSFITIKRATLGRTYAISKGCIMGKTPFSYRSEYNIQLHLKNGKMINTGGLNCKRNEFDKIVNELPFKEIVGRKALKEERAKFENYKIGESDLKVNRNYFFPTLLFTLIFSLMLGIILLTTNFNYKYGRQDHFQVSGVVIDKKIEERDEKFYYSINVLEDHTSEKHEINVNKEVFQGYEVNDGIFITGIRGSLGILYEINLMILH